MAKKRIGNKKIILIILIILSTLIVFSVFSFLILKNKLSLSPKTSTGAAISRGGQGTLQEGVSLSPESSGVGLNPISTESNGYIVEFKETPLEPIRKDRLSK